MKNIKMALNPFCEIAMEQAVQLKEKKIASEVNAPKILYRIDCSGIDRVENCSRATTLLHGFGCR